MIRLALRICAVEALKGNTRIGENIHNSRHGALDIAAGGEIKTNQDEPFIAVYTETSIDKNPNSFTLRANKNLDFIFEFAITQSMSVTDEDGVSRIVSYIPDTDEGMEIYLDLVGTDISAALRNDKNEWADLWRRFAGSIVEVEYKRVSSEMNGTSLAAHQLRLCLNALPDPVLGEEIKQDSVWAKFIELLNKYNHPYAPVIVPMFALREGSESDQRRFGLTLEEARSLAVV